MRSSTVEASVAARAHVDEGWKGCVEAERPRHVDVVPLVRDDERLKLERVGRHENVQVLGREVLRGVVPGRAGVR